MVNQFLAGTVDNTTFSGSIGPVSRQIVATNSDRMSLVLVNDGTNTIYLSLGKTATAGRGIRLNSAGGSFQIDSTNWYTGTISAVTSTGTSNVTIMEMLTK